ncbi:MAG TPA: ABC transporter permease [Anaerolineales bacterium]|nr:ABC transporter permease [Anaerolineales bacterium]
MSLLSILGVISSAIFSGTSLLYATLGEILNERAGIVNLGLEGVLLVSASSGFAAAVATGSPFLGILAAMLAGGLTNLLFAYLVIGRRANQLASGLTIMFMGFGLSALIGNDVVGARIPALPRYLFPGFGAIPALNTGQFKFDMLIYLVGPLSLLVWWALFRTRWGLSLRAVGENPNTAFAAGRNPAWIKVQALFLGGMLAGLGAAHLSIAWTMTWAEYMTAGRGFIAVALVIFSKWHPLRAIAGALLFGGAIAFQLFMQASGIAISPFLLETIPYVLTLVVLIAWGGSRRFAAPASLGRVYQSSES